MTDLRIPQESDIAGAIETLRQHEKGIRYDAVRGVLTIRMPQKDYYKVSMALPYLGVGYDVPMEIDPTDNSAGIEIPKKEESEKMVGILRANNINFSGSQQSALAKQ